MGGFSVVTSKATDFNPVIHVYEPHSAALPPMGPYLREFWRRRRFATELARFSDKATYLQSPLGRIWIILNPLMLAMIYYLLVSIIRGRSAGASGFGAGFDTLAHILIGLFTFYFAQNCMNMGGSSVTAGGRLILNQAFPRALLPFSSVVSGFRQFVPTLPVYLVIYLIGYGLSTNSTLGGLTFALFWVPVLVFFVAVSGFGLAMLFATLNVYFRDTSKLLSYTSRIWLYLSPVLWEEDKLEGAQRIILWVNPLGPVISSMSTVWIKGEAPSWAQLGATAGWAFGLLLLGGYVFISRERDFAVRI
jgi:teichoic acid transport system permease protein